MLTWLINGKCRVHVQALRRHNVFGRRWQVPSTLLVECADRSSNSARARSYGKNVSAVTNQATVTRLSAGALQETACALWRPHLAATSPRACSIARGRPYRVRTRLLTCEKDIPFILSHSELFAGLQKQSVLPQGCSGQNVETTRGARRDGTGAAACASSTAKSTSPPRTPAVMSRGKHV